MAFTRDERFVIQELIRRVKKLEEKVASLQISSDSLDKMLERIESKDNMEDWPMEQWQRFLNQFDLSSPPANGGIVEHDHTNNQSGGPCFATKGANLIE